MEIALAFVGLVIIAGVGYVLYKRRSLRKATLDRDAEVFELVKPVADLVERGEEPPAEVLTELAADPALRSMLFAVLRVNQKENLFPAPYLNMESGAESSLVYWLLHPDELGSRPDHLRFLKKVSRTHQFREQEKKTELDYYVFKFRMNAPHWASEEGWMLGTAGPYVNDSEPYDFAPATFSNFTSVKSQTPEEFVHGVHTMAVRKKLF
jgi:hypothetical protein